MTSLLASFEKTQPKKAFQTYVIEHGIERIAVKIPVDRAVTFEEQFSNGERSKSAILLLVEEMGGKIGKEPC